MSNDQKNLRAREWLLIIIAIIIGEYLFIEKVFKYGADQGIVGYVSFAGTIVSIILAVLAIVYSYYQNFAQKRDSTTIASQVELLRTTVNDVRLSKTEFADDLKRMNEISDKLDQSLSIVDESRTQVTRLTSDFDSFRKSFENPASPPVKRELSDVQGGSDLVRFFSKLGDGIKPILYALFVSRNAEMNDADRARQYATIAITHWAQSLHKVNMGALITTYSIFSSLGLITASGKQLTFDPQLEKYIVEEVESHQAIIDDRNKKIITDLKSHVWPS